MSDTKSAKIVNFYIRVDMLQETNILSYSMRNRFCDRGKFCGSYHLFKGDIIRPVLVISNTRENAEGLGNTHLVVVTNPLSQQTAQPCSPFSNSQIATHFKQFERVGYQGLEDLPDYPEEVAFYVPADNQLLMVNDELKIRESSFFRWSVIGYLVLDRAEYGCGVTEPTFFFDPEVIVGTGRD